MLGVGVILPVVTELVGVDGTLLLLLDAPFADEPGPGYVAIVPKLWKRLKNFESK